MNMYPIEQSEFLRVGFASMRIPELTQVFNERFGLKKTDGQIRSCLKNHQITCGRKPGFPAGYSFLFSRRQEQFIRDNYTRLSQAALAVAFNVKFMDEQKTAQQIITFIKRHHIKSGRNGCFEKGHVPANAGTKGLIRPNSGTFKKGNIPGNLKPLGTERINKGYIEVKIAERNPHTGFPTRYKCKHVVLWEQIHGPVPKGFIVIFMDGEKLHCVPGNLILINRQELLRLNKHQYKKMPDSVKPSVLALVKLEVKTFELSKNQPIGAPP